MDILNSGSFVPLDNREKIEQLIFTAKTLAIEVSRAEGFQSSGPTNHQLGLEMWKGAEYMCRAHEEANIRNLFLGKFLETLREIERQSAVQRGRVQAQVVNPATARPPDPVQTGVVTAPPTHADTVPVPMKQPSSPDIIAEHQSQVARDEYLGVVSPNDEIDIGRPSYADECKPDFEREIAAINDGTDTEDVTSAAAADEVNKIAPSEPIPSEPPQPTELVIAGAGNAEVSETSTKEEPFSEEPATPEHAASGIAAGIDSIVLSEKEPYNFDSCTITSVVQLLPANDGMRKCVVSVRSHDFAPQITISDVSNVDVNERLRQCLEAAVEQYRTNLPVLAAEKVKKQKPAGKKRTSKADAKDAKASSISDANTSVSSTASSVAENARTAKDQQNLFAS